MDDCALAIEYVAFVAPAMGLPLKFHWYVGAGEPLAAAVNVAALPLATVTALGCVVNTGAVLTTTELTVRTEAALEMDPTEFVAVTV